jgi:SAM-dependent methyltransferase
LSEKLLTCLLCRASDLYQDTKAARQLSLADSHGVTRCCRCGLRFLNPRPTPAEYESTYRDGTGPLAADYPVPARYYAEEDRARIPEYRTKLDLLARAGAGRRMLEIGACTGAFLNEARRWGFDVDGIEPSEASRRLAHSRFGLLLRPGRMEDQDLPPDSCDVIFSSNVFEHLLDPLAATQRVCRWLRPGGLLMLEVPNQFDSFAGRRHRWLGTGAARPRSFLSVHHAVFFSRGTLRQLVLRAGLSPCRLRNVYYCSAKDCRHPLRVAGHIIGALAGGSGVIEVLARKPRDRWTASEI